MCFWNFYVMVTLSEDDKFQPAERDSKCRFKNPKIMFSSQFLFDLLDKTVYDMQLECLNTRWSFPSVSHLKAVVSPFHCVLTSYKRICLIGPEFYVVKWHWSAVNENLVKCLFFHKKLIPLGPIRQNRLEFLLTGCTSQLTDLADRVSNNNEFSVQCCCTIIH